MSETKNPYGELLSKQRLRASGDLIKLKARLWHALNVTLTGLDDTMAQDDAEEIRKWIHCLSQLSHTYIKCSIDGDIEQRLRVVEQAMSASQEGEASGPYSPARRR